VLLCESECLLPVSGSSLSLKIKEPRYLVATRNGGNLPSKHCQIAKPDHLSRIKADQARRV